MNDNGSQTTYARNLLNQFTGVSGYPTPEYDTKFNLKGFNGWTYVYDADNRLKSASNSYHSAQFLYDGLGRCVRRTIDGEATVFTYDDWKPIVEWDGVTGQFVAWNLYGPGADEILVRYQPNTGGYVHYNLDPMGNVQYLLSEDNLGLEKYTYDVFGRARITGWNGNYRAASLYGNRFMFTGREYLYTLGIYDYRHRHYHPGLGRFMQVDPIGFNGDPTNLYRYCGANPILHSDPKGLVDNKPERFPRDFMWDFAKYGDSAYNFQGSFAEFTHGEYMGGAGGAQGSPKSIASASLEPASHPSVEAPTDKSFGEGTTIERSEAGKARVNIPLIYQQVLIKFKYVLKDSSGKPLPAGVCTGSAGMS